MAAWKAASMADLKAVQLVALKAASTDPYWADERAAWKVLPKAPD